jgi:uncharacterized SAM-binding protein YcdF (DUF218 family)
MSTQQVLRPARSGHGFTRLRLTLVLLLLIGAGLVLFMGRALVVSRPLPHADAIVVLASHEWERLPLAVRLAGEHPDAVVLLTQPHEVTEHNCHECPHRAAWLVEHGVDASRIHVVPLAADGTYREAQAALALARDAGVHRLIVATSPYHTRRSLAVFRSVLDGSGIEVGIVPAVDTSSARPSRWWMGDYDRRYVAYEWAAVIYYAWQHGVPPL